MAGFADIELDSATVAQLQRGESEAVGELYRQLAPTVNGMALRILQDAGLAQEVVQDTFVELLEHHDELRNPQALLGWMRTVAVNHCYMRLRSPWHKRRVGPVLVEMNDSGDQHSSDERLEGMQDIERALGTLPSDARMVIWLHDVEGYTHGEIGALMGRTASYSKSQLARGYEKLVGRFGGNDDRQNITAIRPACTS